MLRSNDAAPELMFEAEGAADELLAETGVVAVVDTAAMLVVADVVPVPLDIIFRLLFRLSSKH